MSPEAIAILGAVLIVGSLVVAQASLLLWLGEPRFRTSWMIAGVAPGALLLTVLWTFKSSGVY